jgi:hypothetical protein
MLVVRCNQCSMDLLLSSTFCTQVLTVPGGRAVVTLQQSVK